jgi:hypothetical protein
MIAPPIQPRRAARWPWVAGGSAAIVIALGIVAAAPWRAAPSSPAAAIDAPAAVEEAPPPSDAARPPALRMPDLGPVEPMPGNPSSRPSHVAPSRPAPGRTAPPP